MRSAPRPARSRTPSSSRVGSHMVRTQYAASSPAPSTKPPVTVDQYGTAGRRVRNVPILHTSSGAIRASRELCPA